jgi:PTH1 family peptidyl-tRNA hydrolase
VAVDWLIVGLGNPGKDYSTTRHNAGFRAVSSLARELGVDFDHKRAKAEIATANVDGKSVILAKPQTWMNLSGESVQPLAHWFKVSPQQILVVYDEMDLPLGVIRIRENGSAGGHNGMKSVIQHLGTDRIPRLRIGVDRAAKSRETWGGVPGSRGGSGRERDDTIGHVLGRFSPDEEKVFVDAVLPKARQAIRSVIASGVVAAMNLHNGVV